MNYFHRIAVAGLLSLSVISCASTTPSGSTARDALGILDSILDAASSIYRAKEAAEFPLDQLYETENLLRNLGVLNE